MALLVSVSLFLVLTVAIAAFGYARYVRPSRILDRLAHGADEGSIADEAPRFRLQTGLSLIGKLLPIDANEAKFARRELASAGIRSDSALLAMAGARLVGAAVFLSLALLLRERLTDAPVLRIVIMLAGGGAGYCLPGFWLARRISSRRDAIRMGLPDALDLLVVCSDAGCALDQAIVNVSRELRPVHPALCDELTLVNLEILAGSSRSEALRSMSERAGEEELKKLVSILIQTDRFGTSISDALRTQSHFLRVRRRQQAEEKAGKVGVKLVFPIFFFCMPSLMIVTAGPGFMQLFKNLLPAVKNFH